MKIKKLSLADWAQLKKKINKKHGVFFNWWVSSLKSKSTARNVLLEPAHYSKPSMEKKKTSIFLRNYVQMFALHVCLHCSALVAVGWLLAPGCCLIPCLTLRFQIEVTAVCEQQQAAGKDTHGCRGVHCPSAQAELLVWGEGCNSSTVCLSVCPVCTQQICCMQGKPAGQCHSVLMLNPHRPVVCQTTLSSSS